MVTRRALIAGLALGSLPLPRSARPSERLEDHETRFLSGWRSGSGTDFVAGIDPSGRYSFRTSLPGRGHAAAIHPTRNEAVMVARRPGRFAAVLDLDSGRVSRMVDAVDGRHFYGHATYSADGRLLFATENDFDDGTGVIGVYDVGSGYRRIAEFPSHGIGPHDIAPGALGDALIVANGGIQTHPDFGRAKLNLDTMSPSLAILDARDGRSLRTLTLPPELHQLSIRHLATRPDGLIALAMQYEGPTSDHPPLVGLSSAGRSISLHSAPEPVQRRMANYCGSVAFDASGEIIGVSSPRGGIFTFWSAEAGDYLNSVEVPDGSGLAANEVAGGFLLSSGDGSLWRYRVDGDRPVRPSGGPTPEGHWDNHLTASAVRYRKL